MLYFCAEWLVKGSSSVARSMGVAPIVIGLTIVAFGTSAPELVVSVMSSVKGKSMIAVGNAVGSNICNITLVLGLAALFQPITCHRSIVRRDIPLMLIASLYLLILSLDSILSRIEGITLFAGILLYSVFNYSVAVKEAQKGSCEEDIAEKLDVDEVDYVASRYKQVFLIVAGIIGVLAGAELVVRSAVRIMSVLGVDEKFIGLTIIAFGTSLPELATSIVAALRKEMDISIGNLVGSNVFNILSVVGAASIIRPIFIPGGFFESGLIIDYFVMLFTSTLPLLMMRRDTTVNRVEGGILLCCYIGYIGWLIIKA